MTIALAPTIGVFYQAFTNGGIPLNAGYIYTYIAGSTTPQATYTTSVGNVQNANPIVLSSSGRPPAQIWLTQGVSYRFDIYDSTGTLIKTYDNVDGINALNFSGGSALVGFLQAGTGAVATTAQAKMREIVSIKDFGALVDGSTDDDVADQAAIDAVSAAGGGDVFFNAGTTRTGTRLNLPSNVGLRGTQKSCIKLLAGVNDHVIRIASGASHVGIYDLEIDGTKATNTGGHGIASVTNGVTYATVSNVYVHDCSASGIYFSGTTCRYINVYGCTSESNAAAGITSGDTISDFTFHGNIARNNGTHGIGCDTGKYGTISSNVSEDNGQGTPPAIADNFTGYNVLNEEILVIGNISRGGLNNGIHFGGLRISYIGNTVTGATQYGLAHSPDTGTNSVFVISGNVCRGNGKAGIYVLDSTDGTVSGNTSFGNTEDGIRLTNTGRVAVTGNSCRGNTLDGIITVTAFASGSIVGNICQENGGDGLDLRDFSTSTLSGNTSVTNTGYGLNQSGTDGNNIITGNNFRNNTAGSINGTYATTTIFANNKTDTTLALASPAGATLTLLPHSDFFVITGTNNITSVTASWPQRVVTLQFQGILTFTDGSNLKLAGNLATSADDTITIVCDGTDWYEVARSVN